MYRIKKQRKTLNFIWSNKVFDTLLDLVYWYEKETTEKYWESGYYARKIKEDKVKSDTKWRKKWGI